jgi:hypothetical protein
LAPAAQVPRLLQLGDQTELQVFFHLYLQLAAAVVVRTALLSITVMLVVLAAAVVVVVQVQLISVAQAI